MGSYRHLSYKERLRIYRYQEMGIPVSVIAKRLQRHRATIARELRRNQIRKVYLPGVAHRRAKGRRQRFRCKIRYNTKLYDYIFYHIRQGWSPEQIAGRMRQQEKSYYACAETIYRYIYSKRNQIWYYYLPSKKEKRQPRYMRAHRPSERRGIKLIHARPEAVEHRLELGHWEADTMIFNTSYTHNITTLVERKTRYTLLRKNANKMTTTIMTDMKQIIENCPKKLWKTITVDQGSEFADFRQIERHTECTMYYCDARSPWQRGSNENMNGRLRRYLPRKLPIQTLTQMTLDQLCQKVNDIPRKCLGFLTPREALAQECRMYCCTSP